MADYPKPAQLEVSLIGRLPVPLAEDGAMDLSSFIITTGPFVDFGTAVQPPAPEPTPKEDDHP